MKLILKKTFGVLFSKTTLQTNRLHHQPGIQKLYLQSYLKGTIP